MSTVSIASIVVSHLPGLIVLGIGGILLAVRLARQPETAYWVALGGVVVLILNHVGSLIWTIGVPLWAGRAGGTASQIGSLYFAYGIVAALFSALGLALIIAAALMRPPVRPVVLPTDIPLPPPQEAGS